MKLIEKKFSVGAVAYDEVARVQPIVASRLAAQLTDKPVRVLEIGCGTGALSVLLAKKFPSSELVFTDISPVMLKVCETKLRSKGVFRIMDGENPDPSLGCFDLIISSMAIQWFSDISQGLRRLSNLLTPGGTIGFSTLGKRNFFEWQDLLKKFNLPNGLHEYPDAMTFPWPESLTGYIMEELITENHPSGEAFLKALKVIGAGTPCAGYRPLSRPELKGILSSTKAGFVTTYHILYGFSRRSTL